jgi:SAM-dependent methyltransferase
MSDARRHAPATERNREPILEVLKTVVPKGAAVLEIASGSGQHAAFFAPRLDGVRWQPTDVDAGARASIDAWCEGVTEVLPAIELDCTRLPWPVRAADVVVCANMIHIAPFRVCEGLFEGAKTVLSRGGTLYLYGPFKRGGAHTAESNARFDEGLRAQNPEWGVRDLEAVVGVAERNDFSHAQTVSMPANNLSVVFQKL